MKSPLYVHSRHSREHVDMNTVPSISLYLRSDGSLLLVKDDSTIEIALNPRQLLDLGMDAMRLALFHNPGLLGNNTRAFLRGRAST